MPIHNNVKNILLFANDTLKKKNCQPDLKTMTDKFKKTVKLKGGFMVLIYPLQLITLNVWFVIATTGLKSKGL